MASVHYYEYFCRCGEFLFHNSNIDSNCFTNKRHYIFVSKTTEVFKKIYISGSNIVKCETCNSCVGGMVYKWFENKPDLIRLCGHLIERRKVQICIHRIQDADGSHVHGEYHSTLLTGRIERLEHPQQKW